MQYLLVPCHKNRGSESFDDTMYLINRVHNEVIYLAALKICFKTCVAMKFVDDDDDEDDDEVFPTIIAFPYLLIG